MPPIIISYFSTFRRKSVIYQPSITLNLAFAVNNAFFVALLLLTYSVAFALTETQ